MKIEAGKAPITVSIVVGNVEYGSLTIELRSIETIDEQPDAKYVSATLRSGDGNSTGSILFASAAVAAPIVRSTSSPVISQEKK